MIPSFHTGAGCECAFGNTIQLDDNETLVTVYSYGNAKELNATAPDKNGNVAGGHIGVLRWKLWRRKHLVTWDLFFVIMKYRIMID